jgi:hypothetical protein
MAVTAVHKVASAYFFFLGLHVFGLGVAVGVLWLWSVVAVKCCGYELFRVGRDMSDIEHPKYRPRLERKLELTLLIALPLTADFTPADGLFDMSRENDRDHHPLLASNLGLLHRQRLQSFYLS